MIPYFYPAEAFGGPVRVTFDVGKELVKRGHEVVVFTSDARDLEHRLGVEYDEVEGMRVHYFRNLSMFPVKWSKLFITPDLQWKLMSDSRSFDVVHVHDYTTYQNIIVHHFAKKYSIPYVLQAHGSIPRIGRPRRKWLYDFVFGHKILTNASRVIALSETEAKEYERVGVSREKIAVIPNGINLTECKSLPSKGTFKRRFCIEEETKIILFLGRINRLKGMDFLIESFARFIENVKRDALLVVAGPDDGYLKETKKLVRQQRIENKVLFTGPLFGMRKTEAYVDASIVACLDSLKEVVFLLVPLEAAACGTPVIVTEGNHIAKLVEKGEFGHCVRYGNVSGLAERFNEMLGNEGLLRKMGEKGRDFVFKNCDWNNIVGMIEDVYEEVVK